MYKREHSLTQHGGSSGIQKRGRRENHLEIKIETILLCVMSKRGKREPAKILKVRNCS